MKRVADVPFRGSGLRMCLSVKTHMNDAIRTCLQVCKWIDVSQTIGWDYTSELGLPTSDAGFLHSGVSHPSGERDLSDHTT
jgi:hypothetical protein